MDGGPWRLPDLRTKGWPLLLFGAAAIAVAGLSVAATSARAAPQPHADEGTAGVSSPRSVRFGRDVRPLLSDRCFHCHGPDASHREAGLRLDLREEAIAARKNGAAIVPGDPEASQAWLRISSGAPDTVMPPPESGKHALTHDEREIIRAWIAQGAAYEPHWAFVPPALPTVPSPQDDGDWCRNEVDRFVLAELHAKGLEPSDEAPRHVLARRVFLDLTGLPPTPEELTAFVNDPREDAYEHLVTRLLEEEPYRTRHAERMATPWLDLARYADTSGIHMDAGRQAWLWRDWVIGAFRDNMPFDRFTIEQLAGDLLPNATKQQIVATGFHRNHVTSDEGGAIDAEYLLEYAVDRVNTTGAVFLGLSVGCARCHDHKFDPISAEDYYGLVAFFNSNEEPGIYSQLPDANRAHEPYLEVPTPAIESRLAQLGADAAAAESALNAPHPEDDAAYDAFARELAAQAGQQWAIARPIAAVSMNGATLAPQPDGSVLAGGANPDTDVHALTLRMDATAQRLLLLELMASPELPQGRTGRSGNGNAALSGIQVEAVSAADPTQRKAVPLVWAWADHVQADGDFAAANVLDPDGERCYAPDSHRVPGGRALLLAASEPFGFEGGTDLIVRLRYESQYAKHSFGRVRVRTAPATDALLVRLPETAGGWYAAGPFAASGGEQAYEARHGPEDAQGIALAQRFGNQPWRMAAVMEGVAFGLAQGVGAEYVAHEIWCAAPRRMSLSLGSDDGIQVFVNGARVHEHRIDRGAAPGQESVTLDLPAGRSMVVFKVVNTGGIGAFVHQATPDPSALPAATLALALPTDAAREPALAAAREAWRRANSPAYLEASRRLEALRAEHAQVVASVPRAMVMRDRAKPTDTYVMTRGLYDKPDTSRPVQRSVPRALGTLPKDAPPTRLGLAEWIVSAENPLTARVTANRLWEMVFGTGLVRTSDDFGMQGEWPSHAELLDWLAVDLRDHGWDLRRTLRTIVTSSTYRQSSRVQPEVAAVDPLGRLLAHFPRQRLSAEQIRDQALFVAGLLVEQVGGPSVKPYQPEGLWQEVAMPQSNTRTYVQDKGAPLWRRSLYTYWKRAAPPPSMLALDAPTREYCATRRMATNTPLQALVLWNDPQFVEAARALAARTLHARPEGTQGTRAGDAALLGAMFERATGSPPSPALTADLAEALDAYRRRYEAAPDDARALLSVGESPLPADLSPTELAAWTLVANAVLASDSAIVKD